MALMNCPECGKEISNTNTNCPHCGFKLKMEQEQKEKKKLTKKDKIAIGIIIAAGALVIAIFALLENTKLTNKEAQEVTLLNENIGQELSIDLAMDNKSQLKESLENCKAIKKQYSQMNWGQKIKIKNYKSIGRQMDTIQENLKALQQTSIDNTIQLIDNIGEVTLESDKKITKAEEAYLALDEEERNQVKNYDKLISSKTDYEIKLIDSIGEVSLENDSGDKLSMAKNIYDELPPDAQQNVTNYSTLKSKRKKYTTLLERKQSLKYAVTAIKEGNLVAAQNCLKGLPSDFSYKSVKASTLKKKLKKNDKWLKLCGTWTTTGGTMKVNQIDKEYGSTKGWSSDFRNGEANIEVLCRLNDDGTVKVMIEGKLPVFTKYSSVSIGVERSTISLNVSKKVTQMGTIRVDKYTTLTLSTSGITASYYQFSTNEDVYFNYEYSSKMNFNKKKW